MRDLQSRWNAKIVLNGPVGLEGEWSMGIDEAGRGCVLGPLVYGAAAWRTSDEEELKAIGFNDSKKLTEKKRESLFTVAQTHPKMITMTVSVEAVDIVRSMQTGTNLNDLSHEIIMAIASSFSSNLALDCVCVDTVGPS